jgi:hypothetical protein
MKNNNEIYKLINSDYGNNHSSLAMLIQEAISKKWTIDELKLVHKYFGGRRLPKSPLKRARMIERVGGSIYRLCGEYISMKEGDLWWVVKIAEKIRSRKGWLALIGALSKMIKLTLEKSGLSKHQVWWYRERCRDSFLELFRDELSRPESSLLEDYGSIRMKYITPETGN